MVRKPKIIILGAGIAGLSTGWRLSEAGFDVTILEKDKVVGGLSKTVRYKTFLFDYSAHRFNSSNPEVIRRFKFLIGSHLIKKIKKTYIRLWGKYVSYPPKAVEIVRIMPKSLLIPASFQFLFVTVRNLFIKAPTGSFSDWTRGRFGKILSAHLNEKYAQKIWKRPASQLSSDWASTRVGSFNAVNFFLAILSLLKYKSVYSVSDPDSDWFYYSDIGIGLFPKRLSEEVQKLGGKVGTESTITNIIRNKNDYSVEYLQNGKKTKLHGDVIVSSLPLAILCRIIKPEVPQKIKSSIEKLDYLVVLVINILLNKKSVNDASWVYYPEDDVIFNYVMEFKNWSRKMVPKDKTSISANVTCVLNDETWKMIDQQLQDKVVEGLIKVGLISNKEVAGGFVVRLPFAYPVLDVNYKSKLEPAQKYFQSLPNFHLIGRTGNFEYINSDKVMEHGLELAQEIINHS